MEAASTHLDDILQPGNLDGGPSGSSVHGALLERNVPGSILRGVRGPVFGVDAVRMGVSHGLSR